MDNSDKFKFLENITDADYAFEAYGRTLAELFENCALAMTGLMADISTVEPKIKKELLFRGEQIDKLLFDFLQELIYFKDAEVLLFCQFHMVEKKIEDEYEIKIVMEGEEINLEKHKLGIDVKAVTYHKYEVKKEKDKWRAQIVLDV